MHFYALTMLSGFAVAFLIGRRRWVTRGGDPVVFENIVMWAIPSGLVGARIYHVLTHWGDYFGPGHLNPFAIWEGGIAMFGSLMGGAIGALIAARLYKVRLWAFGDCIAPGIAVAQAVGRLGNWFNQELFGQPSTAPVSYTHLDVYKRQVIASFRADRSRRVNARFRAPAYVS